MPFVAAGRDLPSQPLPEPAAAHSPAGGAGEGGGPGAGPAATAAGPACSGNSTVKAGHGGGGAAAAAAAAAAQGDAAAPCPMGAVHWMASAAPPAGGRRLLPQQFPLSIQRGCCHLWALGARGANRTQGKKAQVEFLATRFHRRTAGPRCAHRSGGEARESDAFAIAKAVLQWWQNRLQSAAFPSYYEMANIGVSRYS